MDQELMLAELREAMTCVVCLDILSPPVVQCHRGHALCKDCQQNQIRCPSCRKPFLADKPTLLCQIAALVKGQCKFQGCSYVPGNNDDHQLWCGFMPTDCKLCDWSGPRKDILGHVQISHETELVSNGSDNIMRNIEKCMQARKMYTPFTAHGLFFWLQVKVLNMDWENHHNVVSLQACLVPNGKINSDLLFTVDFKSNGYNYEVRKAIQPKTQSDIKSCVFIPELFFVGIDGRLSINIARNELQRRNARLNLSAKYKLPNRINDLFVSFKNHLSEITMAEVIIFFVLAIYLLSLV